MNAGLHIVGLPGIDHARADVEALVTSWERELGHRSPVRDVQRITLTRVVKDRMATEIAALVDTAVHSARAAGSIHFKDLGV